jgi:hypothetical protein
MEPILSSRQATGRRLDLSHSTIADVSYKVPIQYQKGRKQETAAIMQQSRTRNDLLFSARKHATTEHNHSKGEISGYGSFTNYLDASIKIYGGQLGR